MTRTLKSQFWRYLKTVKHSLNSPEGTQYSSATFRKLLDELNIMQSFSAKGCTFDNAVVEAFFKFLKAKDMKRKTYSNLADLQLSLFEYIDGFYNTKRPHSAINFLSHMDFKSTFFASI